MRPMGRMGAPMGGAADVGLAAVWRRAARRPKKSCKSCLKNPFACFPLRLCRKPTSSAFLRWLSGRITPAPPAGVPRPPCLRQRAAAAKSCCSGGRLPLLSKKGADRRCTHRVKKGASCPGPHRKHEARRVRIEGFLCPNPAEFRPPKGFVSYSTSPRCTSAPWRRCLPA